MRISAVFFLGVLSFSHFIVPSVHAQTASDSSPIVVNPVDLLGGEVQQLKDEYARNLSIYRNDERLYIIARGQYKQLPTLASLEEVVQSTRTVMLSRGAVLQTHLHLLRVSLQNTPGIDLNLKALQLKKIDASISALSLHITHVQSALDKPSIAVMSAEFASIEPQFETLAVETLSLITYGNIQAVYDKTLTVKDEVQKAVFAEETDAIALSAKKRGLDEINRNLSDVGSVLKNIQTTETESLQSQRNSQGSQNNGDLNTVFAGLSRTLSLLQEEVTNK